MSKTDFFVGLDVGTTKICCIVGGLSANSHGSQLDILGFGNVPSTGIRKGIVVNIEATVESVTKSVKEAELMAGIPITRATVGVAGAHIKCMNSTGIVAVKEKEVRQADVTRVLDAARAVAIPTDREILHVIPQEYLIDGQEGIRDPIGMNAVRLESKVHIITGASSSVQNLIKCCNRAGLQISELCLEPLATSEAILSSDERELGVALIDIGGGTTDIAVFKDGSLLHTAVIPLGGNHVTNDVAIGLRTPFHEAERIKVENGVALKGMAKTEEAVSVPGIGARQAREIPRRLLGEIIQPRLEEIFGLAQKEISKAVGSECLSAGIVLTGGGVLLEGTVELSEMIFEMPVKRGTQSGFGGLADVIQSPRFSTALGLLRYAARDHVRKNRAGFKEKSAVDRARGTVKNWFRDLF